jgi:predicted ester cyclase
MSTEDNKKAARRMIEEPWNAGNLGLLDELCDPSYHMEGMGGLDDLKQLIQEYRRGFPDMRWTAEEAIAEGDTAVVRWRARGAHTGEFESVAPTGKELAITGITIFHFANGKCVDSNFEFSIPSVRQYLLDTQ